MEKALSIRSITSTWFECKVRYGKEVNGDIKMVTEVYTVDALSFTEAESRITQESEHFSCGEFKVANINPAPYGEVIISDNSEDEAWFRVKVSFNAIDDKAGKVKQNLVTYLVQANSIDRAKHYIEETLRGTVVDHEVKAISEMKIVDVFRYLA